jgi:hypothetical protein
MVFSAGSVPKLYNEKFQGSSQLSELEGVQLKKSLLSRNRLSSGDGSPRRLRRIGRKGLGGEKKTSYMM